MSSSDSGSSSHKKFEYYTYDPSLPAAIIFIIAFLITALLHTYQLFRTRAWFYIPLVIGTYFEWIGYIGRAIAHTQSPNFTLPPYILQSVLLLVAPALFSATIYMTLGRIVRILHAEDHLFIRATWLTKIFVCGDVVSFFIQAAGAGIMAGGKADSLTNGAHIVIAGLIVQVLFFLVFVAAGITFHLRMNKDTRRWTMASEVPWVKHMMALYLASIIILVRSIYRIIEYAQGFDGYIITHEVYLYCLDALLMLIVLVLFNVVHGSELKKYMSGPHTRGGRDAEQASLHTIGSK